MTWGIDVLTAADAAVPADDGPHGAGRLAAVGVGVQAGAEHLGSEGREV